MIRGRGFGDGPLSRSCLSVESLFLIPDFCLPDFRRRGAFIPRSRDRAIFSRCIKERLEVTSVMQLGSSDRGEVCR